MRCAKSVCMNVSSQTVMVLRGLRVTLGRIFRGRTDHALTPSQRWLTKPFVTWGDGQAT